MVAAVDAATGVLLTVKVALVLPAATVTLEGTLAAALLLESATCAPALGAGPLRRTVAVDDCEPVIVVGLNVSEEALGRRGSDVTGSVTVWPRFTCTCDMYCPP